MTVSSAIRDRLTLPAVCAPMSTVSGPELVGAACAAGVLGELTRNNADSDSTFENWLARLEDDLSDRAHREPNRRVAQVGVSLRVSMPADETDRHLAPCARHGVGIIVSAGGDPSELARRVHDHGLLLWHDVTSLRVADKAIAAGADGGVRRRLPGPGHGRGCRGKSGHDAQPVGAMTGEVAGSLPADAEVITRFPPVDANRPELVVWLYRTGTRRAMPTDRRTP